MFPKLKVPLKAPHYKLLKNIRSDVTTAVKGVPKIIFISVPDTDVVIPSVVIFATSRDCYTQDPAVYFWYQRRELSGNCSDRVCCNRNLVTQNFAC